MTKVWCVGIVFGMFAGAIAGAQVESPASLLEAASTLTSLDGIDAKPWHLKLDVTLIDDTKIPREGTIEVWHAGADQRTVYTFGDATSTTLRHEGKTYYIAAGPSIPFGVNQVLEEFVHPGPGPLEMNGATPELRKQKFGATEFQCVMLTQPIKGSTQVPLGLFPTYCLGDGIIRIEFNFGGQVETLNRIGTFMGHDVGLEAVIREGQVEVAMAKVVTLATYTPVSEEFRPAEWMKQATGAARIAGGVMAGNRVTFVQPVYPESAKIGHKEGTVILHAIIGRDGHIHSLRPANAAEPDFVIAAIVAVRQWIYRPYLLNGEPTEVDSTITVNFRLNG